MPLSMCFSLCHCACGVHMSATVGKRVKIRLTINHSACFCSVSLVLDLRMALDRMKINFIKIFYSILNQSGYLHANTLQVCRFICLFIKPRVFLPHEITAIGVFISFESRNGCHDTVLVIRENNTEYLLTVTCVVCFDGQTTKLHTKTTWTGWDGAVHI